MSLLKGRLALVTGGGSGIGRAVCIAFAREGAQVVAADINQNGAQQTLALISDESGEARKDLAVFVDVAKSSSVNAMFEEIGKSFSRSVDVVVNCAGIAGPRVRFTDLREDDFDQVLAVNLKGTFLVCQAAVKAMLAAEVKDGAIINISSYYAQTGSKFLSDYASSKAGVLALTKSLVENVASAGIRCNCIVPGFIVTPMTEGELDKLSVYIPQKTPMQRFGQPEEVANACLFLASSMSSYVTGQALGVNGGII